MIINKKSDGTKYDRSTLEKKFEKLWEKHYPSIPLIVEQTLVKGRRFRSDYWHKPTGTTIEIMGGTYMKKSAHSHEGRERDYEKQNLLLIGGYSSFCLGTSQVNEYWVKQIGYYLRHLAHI